MIVVADASPLIAFAILDHLDILSKVFDKILVPDAVYAEISIPGKPYAEKLANYFKNDTVSVNTQLLVQVLEKTIDKGEAEAITLALEKKIPNILIDDYKGRKVAKINNLQTIGTIGVLLQAKKLKIIKKVKPLFDMLIQKEIRISVRLYNKALEIAKEQQ